MFSNMASGRAPRQPRNSASRPGAGAQKGSDAHEIIVPNGVVPDFANAEFNVRRYYGVRRRMQFGALIAGLCQAPWWRHRWVMVLSEVAEAPHDDVRAGRLNVRVGVRTNRGRPNKRGPFQRDIASAVNRTGSLRSRGRESAYDSHNRALTTAFDVATDVGLRRKDLAREDESSEQDRPRNFPVTSCSLSPGPSAISQRVDLSTFQFYARDPLATTDVTVGARSRIPAGTRPMRRQAVMAPRPHLRGGFLSVQSITPIWRSWARSSSRIS